MKPIDQLTEEVIGLAMKVHRALGAGFLESVYQNALLFELARTGFQVDSAKVIKVRYEQTVVGDFVADLIVDDRLIIELKAVQTLTAVHEVQTVNYLTATGIDDAPLLNFGTSTLQFKRKRRLAKPNPVNPVNPVQKIPPDTTIIRQD
jgi:GxxExxY protein